MGKTDQTYEDYWKYTAAITKIESFDDILLIIIEEIDKGLENSLNYSKVYKNIEKKIINLKKFKGKDPDASARKYVNQFVKLGFIKTGLRSYHKDTETFINAKGNSKRKLLSNIFWNHNKLNASTTNEDNSKVNRAKFLVKTIENKNKRVLDKDDQFAIMLVDVNLPQYKKGYISEEELNKIKKTDLFKGFKERKYNQRSHLSSILKFLKDYIYEDNGNFLIKDDVSEEYRLFNPSKNKGIRDEVEQRIFRDRLFTESNSFLDEKYKGICMSSGLDMTPGKLIASHIWAYRDCPEELEFEPDNGLLLGENRDYLFDQGKISYDDEGEIIYMKLDGTIEISTKWIEYLKRDKINSSFLNQNRKRYLNIHRMTFNFEKQDANKLKKLKSELLMQIN